MKRILIVCLISLCGCAIRGGVGWGAEGTTWARGGGAAGPRQLTINGAVPNDAELATLAELEASYGVTLPSGQYWYDAVSGAFGRWGGPTEAVLVAGLDLGPALPSDASGGGTSVLINGRELQASEKAYLEWLVGGTVAPGRYTLDAEGNAGFEGQQPMVNLTALAAQRSGGGAGGGNASGGNAGASAASGGTTSVYGGTDANGHASWFESDGRCRYLETPSGSFSAGC